MQVTSTSNERIYYSYIRENADLYDLVQASFFENPLLKKCVDFDKRFRKKYYQLPTYHQTEDFFVSKAEKTGASKEDLNEISETLEVIFSIQTDQYEEEWLSDNTKAWIVFKNMDTSIMDAIEFVQTSEVTTENVKQIVDKVKDIILTRNNLAFDFEEGLDFFEPKSHYQSKDDTFTCGYPFIDACLGGGYQTGNLIVILGASKSGKCCVGQETINIRNKKTGKIKSISLEDFYKLTK